MTTSRSTPSTRIAILALGASSHCSRAGGPASLARLKALELGVIAMLASLVTFVQCRLMLVYALREDRMMAQLTIKNFVFLTSILILTYGLYVPKSWSRAALVVGPLALLPFASVLASPLRYPEAMAWLAHGWQKKSATARFWLVQLRRDAPAHPWPSASAYGPVRSPGCAGRSPRPGSSASIASGGGSAPAGWGRSTSPSTSS